MNEYISKFGDRLSGVLTGFDRLVFRGNLSLNYDTGDHRQSHTGELIPG